MSVATKQHATAAVDAAAAAMRTGLAPHARARVLAEVSRLIETHAEELAGLITAETGKPITASRAEVARAVITARLSAEEAGRLPGETVPLDAVEAGDGTFAFTMPGPLGIVAAVTPFNFPLNLVLHKVGPALAAGCAVVLKPSEHAPLTAGRLTALFERAGLPAGWLNLVTGPPADIVDAWLADDRVAVVTFTGSSAVGWRLKARSPASGTCWSSARTPRWWWRPTPTSTGPCATPRRRHSAAPGRPASRSSASTSSVPWRRRSRPRSPGRSPPPRAATPATNAPSSAR
ncbi:hypothetical protein GCM10027610_108100 [Dactylosporangium cerinum]